MYSEAKIKNVISIFFIVSHFFFMVLALGLYLFLSQNFDLSTLKATLSVILPIFSGFLPLIIKYVIDHRNEKTDSTIQVNSTYVFIVFTLLIFFVGSLLAIILEQLFHASRIADYSFFLTLPESFFGVYIGTILRSMFEVKS